MRSRAEQTEIMTEQTLKRAMAELRRGGVLILDHDGSCALIRAAETTDQAAFDAWRALVPNSARSLIATHRRMHALALIPDKQDRPRDPVTSGSVTSGSPLTPLVGFWSIGLSDRVGVDLVAALCDPTIVRERPFPPLAITPIDDDTVRAGIGLLKQAGLLPSLLHARMTREDADRLVASRGFLRLDAPVLASALRDFPCHLVRIAEASIPLADAEAARVVAFRPDNGGTEHLAIIIGDPPPDQPVLTRLHSECFTGDLLGSLRCDCGEQLRGAIRTMAAAGGGVVLYLAQEGRGIGLVNKLRAYQLQDAGFDTVDANEQLGFDPDERVYGPAAEMLRLLGYHSVRLLTNNPEKLAALPRHGITVVERVPHSFTANDHNRHYLDTKAKRSGHLF